MSNPKQRRKGYAKLFLSSAILPWVFCDFFISYFLFDFFAGFGRGVFLESVRLENGIAAVTLASLFCLVATGLGFFERENRLRQLEIIRLGTASWALAIAVGIAILHFAFFMKVGRYALVYGSFASLVGVIWFHLFMARLLQNYPHQFVFVGPETATSKEVMRAVVARSDTHLEHNSELHDAISMPISQIDHNSLASLFAEVAPVDIVLTSNSEADKHSAIIATIALQKGLRVIDEGSFYAEIFRRYPIENLSTHYIVRAGFDTQKPITNSLKRLFDVTGGLLLLTLGFVPMLLICLAIKLTSRGPIFFIQLRQGRYSEPFRMIKFRTMATKSGGSFATAKNDSRITKTGKMLRPFHLDELPQVFNIIKGEMSFVGPRPESIEIVNKTKTELPIFEIRHMVRPGLTGWAQINQGKTEDGLDEVRTKLSYDLYYAKNYGLVLDALIALRTVFVLTKRAW